MFPENGAMLKHEHIKITQINPLKKKKILYILITKIAGVSVILSTLCTSGFENVLSCWTNTFNKYVGHKYHITYL